MANCSMMFRCCLLLFVVGLFGPSVVAAQDRGEPPKWFGEKKPDRKVHFFYRTSQWYLTWATVLDGSSTALVLSHPHTAYKPDGSALWCIHSTETGWTGPLFGKTNITAAVAGNVGLNLGVGWLSDRLYRKGGRWRIAAIALNMAKATENAFAGFHNIQNFTGIDVNIRRSTGYTSGRIVWSR